MLLLTIIYNQFPPYFFPTLILFIILSLIIDAVLILDNRMPHHTWTWVLFFLVAPITGWIYFLLVGRHQRNFFSREENLARQNIGQDLTTVLAPLQEQERERIEQIQQKYNEGKSRLLKLAQAGDYSLVTTHNALTLLQNGDRKFPRLFEDIVAAESTIHMQYFEWYEDQLTYQLKDLLIKKAQEGVQVRILIDALGHDLSKQYRKELREGGVHIYTYLKFQSPFSFHTINYRNHRKIVVLDGHTAYVGGMNMGQMYLDGGEKFNRWRDTHLRLEGESVAILQGIFITSWYNTTKEKLDSKTCFPTAFEQNSDLNMPIQITTSGPDSNWQVIKQLYFAMILDAQNHVYIQSPFFIPDAALMDALLTASLSGVDIKLMIAKRGPSYSTPYWAASTYFSELAAAGVEIYLYTAGYLHAKTVNIDNKVCCIGSANIDIRSFSIDYEITSVIYDKETAAQLGEDFLSDLQDCEKFDLEEYRSRSRLIHLRDSVARLVSPIL